MTIRVLIVDDERPARDELAYLLSAHPDVESAEAASAAEALRKLADERFDLVLQDIQMPGHDGFHVLREAQLLPRVQSGEAAPLFVFVTAFDQHAIRAFEENALDYLLKPVAPSRLARCLDRVRGRLAADGAHPLQNAMATLLGALGHAKPMDRLPVDRLAVEHGGRISLIPTRDVVMIEAEEKRIVAVTDEGRLPCHNMNTLARAEERLAGLPFFRVNRAVLVNLERIAEFSPWINGKYHIVMNDADRTEVTVSRNRARDFRARLGV
ncbi:LytTR family transcriptional regulator DNA-binding domain-containing protein [Nitratidesulfovibrio sp. HK-II]|uniref:LytR/AlgR family response regulator transcription factor n=1 Tax=Nitratidesulfovibrio sp. HK-II TaxID=2009266 RepID=UPI000E2E93C8|nr:LytTR family transcriptional regulator DNA-binding domain-containing protein [Nitratidesulfovibrio sp. HK-II]GBO95126.1 DNA-binding response regulator LytR [Nitratidesulfovibrio sp. HK-II]